MTLTLLPEALGAPIRARGRLNEASFAFEIAGDVAAQSFGRPLLLYLGAHFHPEDRQLSWVDDLEVRVAAE